MNAKIIRRFDEKGRIVIPMDLLEFLQIERSTKLAICYWKEDGIMIRKLDDIKDCEICAITHIDNQKRISIPKEIVGKTHQAKIHVKNGALILEKAH